MFAFMPAVSVLSPEVWEALKLANIRGATDEQLSRQFEVSEVAIRTRRHRDGMWKAAMSDRDYGPKTQKIAVAMKATNATSEAVLAAVTGSMQQIGADHPLRWANYLNGKLKQVVETDTLPTPSSWKEAATADSMLRRAVGLDKEGTTVSVNLAMFGHATASQGEDWETEGTVVEMDGEGE